MDPMDSSGNKKPQKHLAKPKSAFGPSKASSKIGAFILKCSNIAKSNSCRIIISMQFLKPQKV